MNFKLSQSKFLHISNGVGYSGDGTENLYPPKDSLIVKSLVKDSGAICATLVFEGNEYKKYIRPVGDIDIKIAQQCFDIIMDCTDYLLALTLNELEHYTFMLPKGTRPE